MFSNCLGNVNGKWTWPYFSPSGYSWATYSPCKLFQLFCNRHPRSCVLLSLSSATSTAFLNRLRSRFLFFPGTRQRPLISTSKWQIRHYICPLRPPNWFTSVGEVFLSGFYRLAVATTNYHTSLPRDYWIRKRSACNTSGSIDRWRHDARKVMIGIKS